MKKLLIAPILLVIAIAVSAATIEVPEAPAFMLIAGGGSTVASGGDSISDDFSSDTSSDYTSTGSSTLVISDGVAKTSSTWATHLFYHETSTGSNDHYVEADIEKSSADESGVVLRCNGTTGYFVSLYSSARTALRLWSFSGESVSSIGDFDSFTEITADQLYAVKVTVSGTTFHAYIDLNDDGDYLDAEEDCSTQTDGTYSTGTYIGFGFSKDSNNADLEVDNLSGGL